MFEIILVLCGMAIVVGINYMIQFCSKVSPCYIEFDDRRQEEMFLMKKYNIFSEKVFKGYIAASLVLGVMILLSESLILAVIVMILQLLYTIAAFTVMLMMYERSLLYWS